MNQERLLRIGVVGFSRNEFDQKSASQILEQEFLTLKEKYGIFEVVSGYTDRGVPRLAYQLADKLGLRKIGYSARQALKVKSGLYPVHDVILVGKKFGDESERFVRHIDQLIRVGGGKQSRHEVELFKALRPENQTADYLREYEVEWYGN